VEVGPFFDASADGAEVFVAFPNVGFVEVESADAALLDDKPCAGLDVRGSLFVLTIGLGFTAVALLACCA
jgi:hypothetical protein